MVMETYEFLQVAAEINPVIDMYDEAKPKRVLEIGCWEGGTLHIWLTRAVKGATVVAVDLEHRRPELYEGWRKPDTKLHVITGSSWDEKIKRQIRGYGPYDWAFIDGDHGEFGVRSDYGLVAPLMNPGGLIALHDIWGSAHDPVYPPGVLFDELKNNHETWEFVVPTRDRWSHGIGVVRV